MTKFTVRLPLRAIEARSFLVCLLAALPLAAQQVTPPNASGNPSVIRATPLPTPGATPVPTESSPSLTKEIELTYADMLFSQKQWPLAAVQYRRFVQDHPASPNAEAGWFRLGECYLQAAQEADAEKTFSYVINHYKKGPFVGSAAYRVAVLKYNAKDYGNSVPYFELAEKNLAAPEGRLQALFNRARALQLTDQTKESIAAYELVLNQVKEGPLYEPALLEVARLLFANGDSEKAYARFKELAGVAKDPEMQAEAYARAGLLAAELGKAEESTQFLDKALKGDSKGEWKGLAQVGLIFNHFGKSEYDKVIEVFEKGQFTIPADLEAKTLLIVAHSYRLSNQLEGAIKAYGEIESKFRGQPEGAEAGYRRLQCLFEKNDGGFLIYADHFIEEQGKIDPSSSRIDMTYLMKGEWFFSQAQKLTGEEAKAAYIAAAEAYEKVKLSNIDDKYRGPRLYKLGWAQVEAGNRAAGAAELGEYLRFFPDGEYATSALAKRGVTLQSLEDFPGALAEFKRLVEKFSESPEAEFAQEQIANIHLARRAIPEMIAAYTTLLEKYPKTKAAAEANYWTGFGYLDTKQYDKVVAPLSKSRDLDRAAYHDKATYGIVMALYQTEKVAELYGELRDYYNLPNLDKPSSDPPAARRPGLEIPSQIITYCGRKLFIEKQYPSAEQMLTLGSTPKEPDKTEAEVWDTLARCRSQLERWDGIAEPLENYLKLVQRPSQRAEAYLLLATANLKLKKFDAARQSADEVMKLVKTGKLNAEARLLLGDIQVAEGQPAEAAKTYFILSQIFPDDREITPRALDKASRAYRAAGDATKAVEIESMLKTGFPDYSREP